MGEAVLRIEAVVHPTENEEKVANAIRKIFGEIALKQRARGNASFLQYEGNASSALIRLRALLEREQIRASAHSLLLRSIRGNQVNFALNKQAAFVGHVSFDTGEESPLGSIEVTLVSKDPQQTISWLTQRH